MANSLNWHFGPGGSEDKGPKDSIELLFKGNKYYSIARESIQNSLDAIADKKRPVRVEFSLFEIGQDEIPNFFSIGKQIAKCLEYYSMDPYAQKVFKNAMAVIKGQSIKCLKVSDYNTIGLEYEGNKGPFYAFMQAVGVNLKSNVGSGGSFGFGKGAYYAASAIKSVLVSSIYGNNRYIFQGKARLTTHLDTKGKKKDYVGIYGLNSGEPVTKKADIPKKLIRKEKGTDIIIMGFHEESEWKDSLIKSVLNNFWLSLAEGNLVIKVENEEINKKNIEEVIQRYYSETDFDGSVNDPESWNPYPYYMAYKRNGDENFKSFSAALPTIGNVRLYMMLKEGLPNRTVYMRAPKMTVFKKTDNRGYGYAGVFVCDNDKGNPILKEMENPQHNEWRKTNYLDNENERPHPDAVQADWELRNFMADCLKQLMTSETEVAQKVIGLDRYLNIPEDLLPEKEGGDSQADKGIGDTETVDKENANEVTRKGGETKVTLAVTQKSGIMSKELGSVGGDEVTFTGTGGIEDDQQGGKGKGRPDGKPGGSPQLGTSNNGSNTIKVPLPIRYRVMAQRNDDGYAHILKVASGKDAIAEIEIHAGVDNDSEADGVLPIREAIMNTAPLNYKANKILNVPLTKGQNVITVKFDTNQKHSLKLSSYEI